MNHSLSYLISIGFVPVTLDTYEDVGHWMFRKVGLQQNIGYAMLRAFRIDLSESWMIFIDTNKQAVPFQDLALLGGM